jgi:eukaryotic-like serine/threonine-protein kinase
MTVQVNREQLHHGTVRGASSVQKSATLLVWTLVMDTPARIGRYRIFSALGAGGMASIHLGCLDEQALPRRPVAIKRLHPEKLQDENAKSLFRNEARIAMRLRHPNAVSVLECVTDESGAYLVMEYVHGVSLAELLQSFDDGTGTRAPVAEAIAVRIAIDLLEGLHAAHTLKDENGAPLLVVHRDVSPQNVMLDVSGCVRIVDFGVAKVRDATRATQEGTFQGKLLYASPEQFGAGAVDARTDIRAVGAILWELLTGKRLIGAQDTPGIVQEVLHRDPAAPSTVAPCSGPLEAVVMKALARDADRRFDSAREMAIALEKSLQPAFARAIGHMVLSRCRDRLSERDAELRALLSAQPLGPTSVQTLELPGRAPARLPRRGLVLGVATLAVGAVALAVALRGPGLGSESVQAPLGLHTTQAVPEVLPALAVVSAPTPSTPAGSSTRPWLAPKRNHTAVPVATALTAPSRAPVDQLEPNERK